jgi:hypothetical protein
MARAKPCAAGLLGLFPLGKICFDKSTRADKKILYVRALKKADSSYIMFVLFILKLKADCLCACFTMKTVLFLN